MATTITANGINFPDGSASAPSIGGTDTNTGLFTGSDIVGFATGGVERIKIASNGNVSIGNNPTVHVDTIFHIEDSGETNIKIEGSTSTLGARISLQNNDTTANSFSQYAFNDAGGQSTSAIQGINTDQTNNYGEMAFLTRNAQGLPPSERVRIDKDGNVGIGTSSPAAKLQVGGATIIGTANTTKTQDGVIIERNSGDGLAHITAGRAGGNYSGMNFYVAGASGVTLRQQIDYQSNFKIFGADGTSERLRITSAGNVGIGTASPGYKLEVVDSGGALLKLNTSHEGTYDLRFVYQNSEANIWSYGSTDLTFGTRYNKKLHLVTNGPSKRVTIDGSGNVGIGRTDPGHKLSILGGSSSQLEIKGTEADLWLNSTGPSGGGIWRILGSTGGSTHRFRIYDNTNSREPFYIDGGTGHSTFTRASTGTVAHFITNARECNILLQNDARTWKIVNYDYTNAGADNLGFHDGTADRFIIKNNGNVQIPDGNLEVASGHGIDFSATADGPSQGNETLDDYERGTYSPQGLAWSGSSWANVTFDSISRYGRYTKIGGLVHVQGFLSAFHVNSSHDNQLAGISLPFAAVSASGHYSVGVTTHSNGFSSSGYTTFFVNPATSNMYSMQENTTSYNTWSGSSNRYIMFQVSYMCE